MKLTVKIYKNLLDSSLTGTERDPQQTIWIKADSVKMAYFDKIKGHNTKVPNATWLDNKLGNDLMPFNFLSKSSVDPMNYVEQQ